jgi:hypothetical protein
VAAIGSLGTEDGASGDASLGRAPSALPMDPSGGMAFETTSPQAPRIKQRTSLFTSR